MCDGHREQGTAAANYKIIKTVPAKQKVSLEIAYSLDIKPASEGKWLSAVISDIIKRSVEYRRGMADTAGWRIR